jgi:hypothetical protein
MAGKRSGVNATRLASRNMDDARDINTPVADDPAPCQMPVCLATRLKSANVFSLMIDGQRLMSPLVIKIRQERGVHDFELGRSPIFK